MASFALWRPYRRRKYVGACWMDSEGVFVSVALQLITGLGRLVVEVSRSHTHNVQNSSVRVIRLSLKPLPAQHTTNTKDEHPCPQRESNPRSQLSSGRRSLYGSHCASYLHRIRVRQPSVKENIYIQSVSFGTRPKKMQISQRLH